MLWSLPDLQKKFQSTLLYKERLAARIWLGSPPMFQSTLLYKERQAKSRQRQKLSRFQSTLLYKERQSFSSAVITASGFNPRSCTRSDINGILERLTALVSIHAPVQGATHNEEHPEKLRKFQSTLLYKERPDFGYSGRSAERFQSTLLYKERRRS